MTTETKNLLKLAKLHGATTRTIEYGKTKIIEFYIDQLAAFSEAIQATATSAPEQPECKPFSYERDSALCEANCNAESDAFFAARPMMDTPEMRRVFYAGHRRAWLSYAAVSAAHGIGTTPQPAEACWRATITKEHFEIGFPESSPPPPSTPQPAETGK